MFASSWPKPSPFLLSTNVENVELDSSELIPKIKIIILMDEYKQTKADRLNHKQGADVRSRMYNINTLITRLGEMANLRKKSACQVSININQNILVILCLGWLFGKLTFWQVDFLAGWPFGGWPFLLVFIIIIYHNYLLSLSYQ